MADPVKKPYLAVRERIFDEVPQARELWDAAAAKRRMSGMLARIRKEAGLTQKDVAERAGWDKGFVSRLEGAAGGVPDAETVARFAQACEATVGLIVGRQQGPGHFHVIDAMTMPAQGEEEGGAGPLERLRDSDLALAEEVALPEEIAG
jgi:transcriptional regulator with XRE-family HTH domain